MLISLGLMFTVHPVPIKFMPLSFWFIHPTLGKQMSDRDKIEGKA